MTSSNENIIHVTGLNEGNPPMTSGFPSPRPVTRSLNVFLSAPEKNGWVNNRDAGDLRHHRSHFDATVINSQTFIILAVHYNDVIMGPLASQFTSFAIVYPIVYSDADKKTSKLLVTGLCAGNSPGTGEFPAQMASYAENVTIWWHHHVIGETTCRQLYETPAM